MHTQDRWGLAFGVVTTPVSHCSACGAALPAPPPVTCTACGASHWRNAKPCAGTLTTHEGRLLLVRRDDEPWLGRWDIPGGFCEHDEHPLLAAERETAEETGLDVEVTGFLGIWLDDYPDPTRGADAVTLNAYYHAVVVGGEERPEPGEVRELGWFEAGELPEEVAFPHHARSVLDAWREQWRSGRTTTPLPDHPTRP